jgi:hypothetical protein
MKPLKKKAPKGKKKTKAPMPPMMAQIGNQMMKGC